MSSSVTVCPAGTLPVSTWSALEVKVCGSLPVTVKVRLTLPGFTVTEEGLNRSASVACTCLTCTPGATGAAVAPDPGLEEFDPERTLPDGEHPAAAVTATSADRAIRAEHRCLTGRTVSQV